MYVRSDRFIEFSKKALLTRLEKVAKKSTFGPSDFVAQKKHRRLLPYYKCDGWGNVRVNGGMWQNAATEYGEITDREPENPWGWLMIGELYARNGRISQARQAFEKLIRLVPSHAMGFSHLGDLCRMEGDYNSSRDFYRQALRLDPFEKSAEEGLKRVGDKKRRNRHRFRLSATSSCCTRYLAMRRPGAKIILSKVRFRDLLWKLTIGGESGNSTTSPALTFVSMTATQIFCPFSSTST